jgi:hypothetical protein
MTLQLSADRYDSIISHSKKYVAEQADALDDDGCDALCLTHAQSLGCDALCLTRAQSLTRRS